ncbi:AAA family ATPase [Endozoicomonas sp. 4G]|uniref:AAA family ATPase n=1 Tax=Endozoicomonas sp. 4G TaxID=2872754 RepID=UPI002078CE80|nr:AAA family ATPase [Endozoicomonas sp. 4G]
MIELENGQLFSFDNLSDGYRNTLAIVADIAHRAGRLNPHLMERAPLETPGIVLIDEVDLHLHPKWQRRVLNDLREAFPKVQLKQELDELSAPFSDNVAYHAFLEMERAASGLGKGKVVEE